MRKVDYSDYLNFIKKTNEIIVEGSVVKLEPIDIKRLYPNEKELTDISTTVWSFPKRGSWATHRGDYRGNWPPQIARALILMYTKPGDTVLDPMIGSGTTCIEAKLLGRNCIGVDINFNAVILTLHRMYWLEKFINSLPRHELRDYISKSGLEGMVDIDDIVNAKTTIYHGDAKNLELIEDSSIDLIATHPPYFNIIKYSRGTKSEVYDGEDLSRARDLMEYLVMLGRVIKECYRVLKPGSYIGILIGDTRVHKHFVPISHYVLRLLLNAGFILREEVVKIQHKMKTTREKWARVRNRDFLLIYHEKLYILRKPSSEGEYNRYKYSSKLMLDLL